MLSNRGDCSFPWRSIWKVEAHPIMAFFIMTVTLGKILTAKNLRRGVVVVSWCYLCKANEAFVALPPCYRGVVFLFSCFWGLLGDALVSVFVIRQLDKHAWKKWEEGFGI